MKYGEVCPNCGQGILDLYESCCGEFLMCSDCDSCFDLTEVKESDKVEETCGFCPEPCEQEHCVTKDKK